LKFLWSLDLGIWSFRPRDGSLTFPRVTVLEVIQRSSDFLGRKGVDSPRLQVELLLAHVLQMPRMKLYLNFERPLTEPELEVLRGLVRRRGEREPLQHIVGSTSFCGLEIAVNGDVLIPRPETELLAEEAWKFLLASKEFPSPRSSPLDGRGEGEVAPVPSPSTPAVLDFGTGSGCLALAIAVKCPQAAVHAIDISGAALAVARANALRLGLVERVLFHAGDGFSALPDGMCFDLVVSNPPYIPSTEIGTLQPEVRDHDPRQALDGGADGLDFYRRLAAEAGPRLKPGGRLMLEHGDGQGGAVAELLTQHGWTVESVLKDYSGRGRILIARRVD
jgi:release factor glutamine methyltransferase